MFVFFVCVCSLSRGMPRCDGTISRRTPTLPYMGSVNYQRAGVCVLIRAAPMARTLNRKGLAGICDRVGNPDRDGGESGTEVGNNFAAAAFFSFAASRICFASFSFCSTCSAVTITAVPPLATPI